MGQNNKQLKKARKDPNDEFYTPYELAKELINPFISQLKGKKIICPCDSPKSYIYIYLKELGLDVDYSTEMHTVNYDNYDIVITNPPFSKMKEFMGRIYRKKWLFIGFWLLPSYKWFAQQVADFKMFCVGAKKYINSNKIINTTFYTNLEQPQEWKKDFEIEEGKIYSAIALAKTNRTDFAEIRLWKNGKESFFKLVYGKTNEWILKNVKDLKEIVFNNYEKNFNRIIVGDYVDDSEQITIWELQKGGE